MNRVETTSTHLVACMHESEERLETAPPRAGEWPEFKPKRDKSATERRARAEVEGRDDLRFPPDDETSWSALLIELSEGYSAWRGAIETAIDLAAGVAPILDAGEPRHAEKWTTRCIADLRSLAGLLDPGRVGDDGLGIVRCRVPVPEAFAGSVEAIADRRMVLLGITDQTEVRVPADVKPMERYALIALRELGALSKDRRVLLDSLCRKAGYGSSASGTFKEAIAGLGRRGFVCSKSGRGGGVWLSEAGRSINVGSLGVDPGIGTD